MATVFRTPCATHDHGLIYRLFLRAGEISELACTATATVAGAISGVVTAPAELLMIQQQKWGGSLMERLRAVTQEHGALSLGKGMVSSSSTCFFLSDDRRLCLRSSLTHVR